MSLSEFDLIQQYFLPTESCLPGVELGIGDDAAVLLLAPHEKLLATVDTSIAGVHFPVDAHPHAIAYRALAVNLSDLAAMGAQPRWFTLALSLPEANPSWLADFARGLAELAQQFSISLVGGDTTRGALSITIQALGISGERYLTRSGAQVGDIIYVSGSLGGAAAGLEVYRQGVREEQEAPWQQQLLKRYLYPQPQLSLGYALLGLANSCIDISDGLLQDLGHIAQASGLGAQIYSARLPLCSALASYCAQQQQAGQGEHNEFEAIGMALSGGDDYQLCFTVAAQQQANILQLSETLDVELTAVGEMCAGDTVQCFNDEGQAWAMERGGYQHF